MKYQLRKALLMLALAVVFFVPVKPEAAAAKKLTMTWYKVGNGDSAFIKFPNGKTVLIDGGTTAQGNSVVKKLKKAHVSTIDYLISTHPDADHSGGLQVVFKKMTVRRFYYPADASYTTLTAKNVMSLAQKESGCAIYPVSGGGTTVKGGDGAYFKFVQDSKDYDTDNQDSIATYIHYGKLDVLTCGDCEKGSQNTIEKHNVDILQLPHHGSKYSTTAAFLKRFDPERVVISTNGKSYGHPHKTALKAVSKYDSKIIAYRTDKMGDITVTATKTKWTVKKSGVSIKKYVGASIKKSTSKKSTTKKSTTKKSSSGSKVYTTATGKRYHCRRNCSGLKRARKIYTETESEARDEGLTKCHICY